jgi:dodecin
MHRPGRIPPGEQTFFDQEASMAGTTEHGKPPAVVRVIELVGVSSQGWSDAARQAVARASQTLRHITGLDVVKSSAVVRDGKITEYHVNVKVAFVMEGAQIEKP